MKLLLQPQIVPCSTQTASVKANTLRLYMQGLHCVVFTYYETFWY